MGEGGVKIKSEASILSEMILLIYPRKSLGRGRGMGQRETKTKRNCPDGSQKCRSGTQED